MPRRTLVLGSTTHLHPKHKVQLVVSASVQISHSFQASFDANDLSLIELLTSKNAWVCRGAGLHFFIQTQVSGLLNGDQHSALHLVDNLGVVLREAEVRRCIEFH